MIRRVRAPIARATPGGEPVVVRPRPAGVPHQSAKLRIARVPASIRGALLAALLVAVSFPSARAGNPIERGNRRPVKVMIISTFGSERQVWLDRLEPWRAIRVPGLAPDYPDVHCNQSKICVFTTGMGHSNAAASVTALVFSGLFELSHTYFIVAAVAGIDPAQGTLGSAAWARYLVEFGLQWEIDAREIPPDWTTGYLGIDTTGPTQKPPLEYRTEVFQLNEALLRRAYALSRAVPLADSAQAQATRAKFNYAPANQPPSVLQCDTVSGDTWFSGALLTQRARDWTKILTDGKGIFCTSQQEDNAIYEALKRGAGAKLLDLDRVAVLRAGSDFLQPYDGQSSADNLVHYAAQGGFPIALENLYRAASPLVQQIVNNWPTWRRGVPAH
jgi:purine nucleoside permease